MYTVKPKTNLWRVSFQNVWFSWRDNGMFINTVKPKTNQWRVSVQNAWFSFRDNDNFINTVKPKSNQWRVSFQNVWFSLRKNHMLIKTYQAIRGTCIATFQEIPFREWNAKYASERRSSCTRVLATFQENPCAKVQNMSPNNGRPGGLSSPLFQRSLVRE